MAIERTNASTESWDFWIRFVRFKDGGVTTYGGKITNPKCSAVRIEATRPDVALKKVALADACRCNPFKAACETKDPDGGKLRLEGKKIEDRFTFQR
jgi:hypothetical protein